MNELPFQRHRWLIYSLLVLASIHCVRSIFFVNFTSTNLIAYENGTAFMPYQGRIAMVPVLRWAHSDKAIIYSAAFLNHSYRALLHGRQPYEEITPEKFGAMLAGILSVIAMVIAACWFGQKHLRRLWVLPPVLTLMMLYTMYAARYEMSSWYPYDLPHFALFGVACLCLLGEQWIPMMLLFALDVPMRETSIYLVCVCIAVGWARGRRKRAFVCSGLMLAIWLPVRFVIARRFRHNPSETGLHLHSILVSIINPLHWPQIASVFGFFLVPLWLGRKYLEKDKRFFLYGAVIGFINTTVFGIWFETRIWGEWILPVSVLLTFQAACILPRLIPRKSGLPSEASA